MGSTMHRRCGPLVAIVALAATAAPFAAPGAAEPGQPAGPARGGPVLTDLPDIGTSADTVLSNADEYRIGAMIVRGLRDSGAIVEDPEITEYVQSVGSRLASHAQDGGQRFTFFVVKDPGINAFALPGGFIGVNADLVLATAGESELASVLAHEIAHVTQRHIARGLEAQGRNSLVSTAAMLAAILLGAVSGNSDIGMAGVMAGQSAAVQRQINFTRDNEYEADRIGIATLVAAGFDPHAMARFFETLGRRTGSAFQTENARILEFLQTHPVTSSRVAEARSRAAQYPAVRPVDTMGYRLTRERLRVMRLPAGADVDALYPDAVSADADAGDHRYYGRALALIEAGRAPEAVRIFRDLVKRQPNVTEFHTGLGQALLAAGETDASREALAHAKELFPRNVPVTVRYAQALLQAGDAKAAHKVLLDLFNVVPPTLDQVRLIALAASSAGETAEANYYMAEYHLMSGDLTLGIETLRTALASPNITPVQRSRFRARIDELKEYLPPRLQAALERGEPLPQPRPEDTAGRRR
ncbi:MAG: M48 family metalloprotease [Steroidobacteraceae bacterium]|nr:M48 family metalloprotease [Steroidobacteraceae bacterium]